MRGEQAIFNLEIKKKIGLSINPDIHHSKVFSSDQIITKRFSTIWVSSENFRDISHKNFAKESENDAEFHKKMR